MRREERVRRIPPPSIASLLTTLCVIVVFTLTGCTADSLTGPVLGPETTLQVDGGQGDNHNECTEEEGCKQGDGSNEHNEPGFDGGSNEHNEPGFDGGSDEHNMLGTCDFGGGSGEHNCL